MNRVILLVCTVLGFAAGTLLGPSLPRSPSRQDPLVSNSGGAGPGSGSPSPSPAPRTRVVALGRIEPAGKIVAVSVPPGDRIESILVKEGELVHEGQELARLASLAERSAGRDRIVAQIKEVELRRSTEVDFARAQLKEATLALQELDRLQPLDTAILEARVQAALASLEISRRVSRANRDAGSIPKVDMERHDLVLKRDTSEHTQAHVNLKRQKELALLQRVKAEAQLATAQRGVARAEASAPTESLKQALLQSEALLASSSIKAPGPGQILKVLGHAGEATGGHPLLQMGDLRRMHVVAEVYETDVRHVKVGQAATISSKALSAPASGTVVDVGRVVRKNDVLGLDPAGDTDARVIEVRIELGQGAEVATMISLQVDVVIQVK